MIVRREHQRKNERGGPGGGGSLKGAGEGGSSLLPGPLGGGGGGRAGGGGRMDGADSSSLSFSGRGRAGNCLTGSFGFDIFTEILITPIRPAEASQKPKFSSKRIVNWCPGRQGICPSSKAVSNLGGKLSDVLPHSRATLFPPCTSRHETLCPTRTQLCSISSC